MSEQNSSTADREISTTRVFDAPRELVWKVWTDPQHIAKWWGPNGFTNTIHEMDVRPGGNWKFIMHGPDGRNYPNHIVYQEITRPQRIVYEHTSSPVFHATITFEDQGGKTKLTMRMIFQTAAVRDGAARTFNAIEGQQQTLNRLEQYIAEAQSVDQPFFISRTFDAPRELVWKAWTERERLMEWFGPKGFTMPVARLDFRPGGSLHYSLRSPDGKEMWGKFVYREIVPPEKIVLVNSFSDENGGLTRHPFSPTWPLEMLSTTTFTDSLGKTVVNLKWQALNATEQERNTFNTGHQSMNMGWTGTFDQLSQYLARQA